MEKAKIYCEEFIIRNYEAGQDGRLKIFSIFNYLQEIASRHAEEIGWGFEELKNKGVFWVLSRMQVEIVKVPLWKEKVKVKTWPSGVEKLYALRDFLITDMNDDILIKASSAWLIVYRDNLRVQPPRKIISDFGSIVEERAMQINLQKILSFEEITGKSFRKASFNELDVNQHVNNARYIEWLMDCYNPEYLRENTLRNILVSYSGQAKENEQFELTVTKHPEQQENHCIEIVNISNNKTILQVLLDWIQIDK